MRDQNKTKEQLISELVELRQRITELEAVETERKRAEEALRKSEARFRNIYLQSPIAIELYDSEGLLIDANPACLDLFGVADVENVKGFKLFEDPNVPKDAIQRLLAGEAVKFESEFDFELVKDMGLYETTKSGRCYVDCLITPWIVEEDIPSGLLVHVQDITERKQAEEALRESEEKFRNLAEHSPNMIFINKRGRVVYANRRCEEMMGYTTDEFYSADFDFLTLIAPEHRELVKASFGKHTKGKDVKPYEYTLVTKDNQRIKAILTAKLIDYEGERAILGTVTDVTERKRAEDLLRAQRDLVLQLGTAVGLDETLRLCVETAIHSTEMDAGGVYLVDETSGNLDLRYSTGLSPDFVALTSHYDADAPNTCLVMEGQPIYVNYRELGVPMDEIRRNEGLCVIAILPILHEGRVIACLNIASHSLSEIPAATRDTLETIAAQIGSFVARARAEEGQRQALAETLQATHALRESEKRLRTLIEQSPFAIEIFDPDGFLRQVNKAWERIWQANAKDVVGKHNALKNEQLQQSSVFPLLERLFAGESVSFPDVEFDPAASGFPGRKRWLRAHTYHLKDEDNQIQNVVFIHEDITEHKQAEEERERLLAQIQEQAQRMQQIMDTVPEGVLLLNADGQVVLANPVAERDLPVLTDARVGDTITHLGNRPLAELLTSPPKGLWHEVKTDALHRQKERIFEIIARPMEKGSEPEDWVMVISDATQQREIEQRVQQQERLAAVGQLAAGIAHDFNNIMATIVLYAQTTSRMKELPSVVRERMGTINQQAGHAAKLIQQILDFSRRAVLERQPLDLALLLQDHVRLLKRTLPESIEVKLTHGPSEYMIHADPTRMQQVVTNLAVNARDAMPGGGTLHIKLERIQVRRGESPLMPEMEPGEWVQMTVSDTGTGISPDVLPHIFNPFFTTKAPGEGSGLGLAQVHGIVGQHGGRIDVESHMGKGTTFTIYLPALSAHPTTLSSVSELGESLTLPTGKGETILVVEDNAIVRKALVESLELLNYRTQEAMNGQEALAMLEQHSDDIDLLLSDVVMPGMGGVALLHALKEHGVTVKVVMITGHLLEKELDELRVHGMIDWLHKPPELDDLAEVVARVLGAD